MTEYESLATGSRTVCDAERLFHEYSFTACVDFALTKTGLTILRCRVLFACGALVKLGA